MCAIKRSSYVQATKPWYLLNRMTHAAKLKLGISKFMHAQQFRVLLAYLRYNGYVFIVCGTLSYVDCRPPRSQDIRSGLGSIPCEEWTTRFTVVYDPHTGLIPVRNEWIDTHTINPLQLYRRYGSNWNLPKQTVVHGSTCLNVHWLFCPHVSEIHLPIEFSPR